MIVPANNFDFTFQTKVEDLLGEKFLNPDSIRYEKRRVWVVDSHLKEGARHLNGKPIPGKFKNGVTHGAKYFTAKGMARSGVR